MRYKYVGNIRSYLVYFINAYLKKRGETFLEKEGLEDDRKSEEEEGNDVDVSA